MEQSIQLSKMKKSFVLGAVALSALVLLSGCVGLSVGGGSKSETKKPTLGQQLTDLQNARNSGAITEEQYEAQKAKLLNSQ